MVELFCALIQAVAEFVAALITLILESLLGAALHLAEKPKDGEHRFSPKRVIVAFAPTIIIFTLIAGGFFYFNWKANVRHANEQETKKLLEANVERLGRQIGEDGRLIRHPAVLLSTRDVWGNLLRVHYEETVLHQIVFVESDGADGKPGNGDDLSSSRQVLKAKKDIAKKAIEKAKNEVRDRFMRD